MQRQATSTPAQGRAGEMRPVLASSMTAQVRALELKYSDTPQGTSRPYVCLHSAFVPQHCFRSEHSENY